MSSNDLLTEVAASLRAALSTPIEITTKEGQKARFDILDMIPELQRKLVGDRDTIRNMTWSPLNLVTLQAINRFGIAKQVPLDRSISYKDLSEFCGVEEQQLRRLVRHAITNGIFHERERGHVAHTTTSQLLAEDPRMDSWVYFTTNFFWPVTSRAVDAIQKWPGSQNPKEVGAALWAGQEISWFEVIAKADRGVESFKQSMEIVSEGEGWQDSFLVENYPWGEFNNGKVVDVGGGNGHASIAIAEAFPNLTFIVQDLQAEKTPVLDHLKGRISYMNYDMFTDQPIKGADIYFWRVVLHNWPDPFVLKALKSVIPALKHGAKVIIQDHGLTDPGEGRPSDEGYERTMDIMMMALMNAKERDLEDWKGLFEKADPRFKWNGGRRPDGSRLWIIEATWEC